MTELDVRGIRHNLLATLSRQPEAYHRKVLAGANQHGGNCASIHDRVVFKQANLDQRIQYDKYPRKSLVDLFYDNETTLAAVASGQAEVRSDFASAVYEAKIRRNAARIQVQLIRDGLACGIPVRITKGLTLDAGSSTLEIAYLLENLPQDRPLHFAVEMNFAGMPPGADDRYFHDAEGNRLGELGARLDLGETSGLYLCDEWLGIDVGLTISRPTQFWTFPIETVSQSEGGFELVHQSAAVQPHWFVTGDRDGRWSVTMQLQLDTRRAESRVAPPLTQAAAVGV
jgi:alpha-amylase